MSFRWSKNCEFIISARRLGRILPILDARTHDNGHCECGWKNRMPSTCIEPEEMKNHSTNIKKKTCARVAITPRPARKPENRFSQNMKEQQATMCRVRVPEVMIHGQYKLLWTTPANERWRVCGAVKWVKQLFMLCVNSNQLNTCSDSGPNTQYTAHGGAR